MQFVNAGESETIEIIGVDGSSWTVSGRETGHEGVELHEGPEGLMEAPRTGIWSQSAFQEGATFLGVSIEPIDLMLSFDIYGDEENWHDISSGFRKAFDYERLTTIRVSTESGTRELQVQLYEAPDRDQAKSPRLTQYSLETYTLRAPWPFWEGDVKAETYEVELRSVPGKGSTEWNALPPSTQRILELSPTATKYGAGKVEVTNPTDTPLWPQWAATGPGRWGIPDFSFQDDDQAARVITTPTLSNSDEGLVVDTYPRNEPYTAFNGSNMAGRFGGVLFLNPVPPYTPPTEVPITYVGTDDKAAITVRLREYWNAPWGGE